MSYLSTPFFFLFCFARDKDVVCLHVCVCSQVWGCTVCVHGTAHLPDGRTDTIMTEYPRHCPLLPSPNPFQTHIEEKQGSCNTHRPWEDLGPGRAQATAPLPFVSQLAQVSSGDGGEPRLTRGPQVDRDLTTSAKTPRFPAPGLSTGQEAEGAESGHRSGETLAQTMVLEPRH